MPQIALERPGRVELALLPPLALYVHIPWCVRKCPYCDFNSHERAAPLPEGEYVAKLLADLEVLLASVWGRRLTSVFIGGGTPSLFSPAAIDSLLSGIRARMPLEPIAEITLEANPGTVEAARFRGFRDAGVNRISLGVQSFDDGMLAALGRIHSAAEARQAVLTALAAFDNVNIDLMYGLPNQTLEAARDDIGEALACGVTRHERIKQPRDYLESGSEPYFKSGLESEISSIAREFTVPPAELPFEFMLNALRLVEGFPLALFQERTGLPLAVVTWELEDAEKRGLLARDWQRMRPTERGRLFLNELLALFVGNRGQSPISVSRRK